ncbi:MAG: HAD-IA family hydrolase [Nitrososphaeria archaeon]|nr:HAD-IA family hydrolase [Nitrososphaeria archaeon]NIQ33180.1 HAD-IA family hydrolase [Nitrososphaeria archaeon]
MAKRETCVVIFDMDGTLIDLPVNWFRTKRRLAELLKADLSAPLVIPSVYKVARQDPDLLRRAFEIIEEEEMASISHSRALRGAKSLIAKLKGHRLAVVTLQGKAAAYKALRKAGLLRFFDEIVTREISSDRAEQIQVVKEKIHGRKYIMIGDRLNDVESAKKEGCYAILLKPDLQTDVGADLVVESLGTNNRAILKKIQELCGYQNNSLSVLSDK